MEIRKQLINDLEILPEHTLRAISGVVKEFLVLTSKTEATARPVFGSGKGQMWIADDFDAPLEELREYSEI
jgi:hypothetical protein